jgi:hypothetical protein
MNEKLKKFTYEISLAFYGKDFTDKWCWQTEKGRNNVMEVVKKVLDNNGINLGE